MSYRWDLKDFSIKQGDVIQADWLPEPAQQYVVESVKLAGGGHNFDGDYPDGVEIVVRRLSPHHSGKGRYITFLNPETHRYNTNYQRDRVLTDTMIKQVKKLGKMEKVVTYVWVKDK